MNRSHSPSTAAMTTLSIAVSVAVVMLDSVRTETIREMRYQLYVDLPFLCVGFLSQPSKPTLEVITTCPGVTWLTFEILSENGQLMPWYNKDMARGSLGRSF